MSTRIPSSSLDEILESIRGVIFADDIAGPSEFHVGHDSHRPSKYKSSNICANEHILDVNNICYQSDMQSLPVQDTNDRFILSADTVDACQVSLRKLAEVRLMHGATNGLTFGQLAYQILRPLLQDWSTNNLPQLVATIRAREMIGLR